MSKRLRILVVCGGPSLEHEVSLQTADMIMKNLNRKKYDPYYVVIQKSGMWKFTKKQKALCLWDAVKYIKKENLDIVFIAMHGEFGEDGCIQAIFEYVGISYTGSNFTSSAITMSKEISNILYSKGGLKVPSYFILNNNKNISVSLPVVVKPVNGGSSVGISIAKTKKEFKKAINDLLKEDSSIMIQNILMGGSLHVVFWKMQKGTRLSYPPTEIIPKTSNFFDYKAKYKKGGSLEITPAKLPKTKIKEIQKLALKAHDVLKCSGMSRSDFILKGNTFFILETNTIPGMTELSLLPQEAKVADIDFPSMLDLIIDAGLRNSK